MEGLERTVRGLFDWRALSGFGVQRDCEFRRRCGQVTRRCCCVARSEPPPYCLDGCLSGASGSDSLSTNSHARSSTSRWKASTVARSLVPTETYRIPEPATVG